ncbi:hypothetical protein C3E89_12245 [Clostridium sp. Cult1]|mgnify:CR=1 FL=1|nr:hypothetical protein [Clostridium sp. Cult1]
MLRECCNCGTKISFLNFYKQYISKNRFRYIFTKCGKEYGVNIGCRIISVVIFILLYAYLVFKSNFTFPLKMFLMLLYILIFEPLLSILFKYEV